jgi:hypothetical protein
MRLAVAVPTIADLPRPDKVRPLRHVAPGVVP